MMLHNLFKSNSNRGGGGGGQAMRPLAALPAVSPLLALLISHCRDSNQRPTWVSPLAEAGYVLTPFNATAFVGPSYNKITHEFFETNYGDI